MASEKYYYKNSVELQGIVINPPVISDRQTILRIKTVETVNRGGVYEAEHDVKITGPLNVKENDFCIVTGSFTDDLYVIADLQHVRNLGCLATEALIFKNHLILHACICSDIRYLSTGNTFDLYTEVPHPTDIQLIKATHMCMAFGKLIPYVNNARKGDFVMVEGHIASNKKIIVSKYNNITQARQNAYLPEVVRQRL